MLSTPWHTQEIPDILAKFNTSLDEGLTTDEVDSRLKRYGSNDIANIHPPASYLLFLRQFYSFTVVILALAAIGLLLLGRFEQSAIVLAILFVNICFKYVQEFRIKKRLELLSQQMTHKVRTLRNGQLAKVDAPDIVPGDVIFLGVGDIVPADARIVEANSLLIDESSLFIESATPIRKNNKTLQQRDLPPGEIRNMAYAGTLILDGSGEAIVTATRNNTELSGVIRLNRLSKNFIKKDCQILKRMRKLRNYAISISIAVGIAIALIIWRISGNGDIRDIFELGMSFIIASSPSSIVTIALSIFSYNAYKIFQQGAAVKHISDFETLGRITAFLADETSNFMNDEMVVKQILVDGQIVDEKQLEKYSETSDTSFQESELPLDLPLIIVAADLSTDIAKDSAGNAPLMEKSVNRAITAIADKIGLNRTEYISSFTKISEVPYNPERKRRNVILEGPDGFFMFTVGDAELILPHCPYVQLHGQLERIDNQQRRTIMLVNQHFANNFGKVLAVAYRQIDAPVDESEIWHREREEVFLGLIAFDAIIADDIKGIVKDFRNSGLKLLMMTDSNKDDAFRTAHRLGILEDRKWIISRKELESLSEDEYSKQVEHILVYSELKSENKMRVIRQLQKRGHVVAIMGNQSSDVKSLNTADVGITVKSQAAGAALDACKLTLLDGRFNIVNNVITRAREAYYSIRNSIRWLLSCAVGQATIIFIAFLMKIFMGLPHEMFAISRGGNFAAPLTLLQIVWINLLVSVIPLVALSKDTITNSIVYTRPRTSKGPLSGSYLDIFVRGIVIAFITLFSFLTVYEGAHLLKTTASAARTVACTVFVLTFLTYCFRCHRRPYETLIQRIFVNKSLLMTAFIIVGLQLIAIYAPHFNQMLGMTPIGKEWLFVAIFSLMGILLPLNIANRR
ncbi:MAG: cation-translocating P-type ATPase [Candidatus Poribacteria bacterium]